MQKGKSDIQGWMMWFWALNECTFLDADTRDGRRGYSTEGSTEEG